MRPPLEKFKTRSFKHIVMRPTSFPPGRPRKWWKCKIVPLLLVSLLLVSATNLLLMLRPSLVAEYSSISSDKTTDRTKGNRGEGRRDDVIDTISLLVQSKAEEGEQSSSEQDGQSATSIEQAPVPQIDGFLNPNHLPQMPRLGPATFFDILAPPYYSKSPVDRSRNYVPGSTLAKKYCPSSPPNAQVDTKRHLALYSSVVSKSISDRIKEIPKATFLSLDDKICSWGPTEPVSLFTPPDTSINNNNNNNEDVSLSRWLPYEFHDVCVTFNIDSTKRTQRGLLIFDPQNHAPHRCVACPNPIEITSWGNHACGLMWTHQINAAGTLRDYESCRIENDNLIKRVGQRQEPGALTPIQGGIRYAGSTLLLSYAHRNPGHQLFDTIFSLLPVLLGMVAAPEHVHVAQAPDCPNSEWACAFLRRMRLFDNKIGFGAPERRLPPDVPGVISCFETLLVAKWGQARSHVIPPWLLRKFQRATWEAFGFLTTESVAPTQRGIRRDVLMAYAHQTISVEVKKARRTWLRMNESLEGISAMRFKRMNVIGDFAALSLDQQARAFYDADVIVMPHGGQVGNAVFCKRGTLLIEIGCNGYSHLGLTSSATNESVTGSIPRALGLIHVVVKPCQCEGTGDLSEADFMLDAGKLDALLLAVGDLGAGTHFGHRLLGGHCV